MCHSLYDKKLKVRLSKWNISGRQSVPVWSIGSLCPCLSICAPVEQERNAKHFSWDVPNTQLCSEIQQGSGRLCTVFYYCSLFWHRLRPGRVTWWIKKMSAGVQCSLTAGEQQLFNRPSSFAICDACEWLVVKVERRNHRAVWNQEGKRTWVIHCIRESKGLFV